MTETPRSSFPWWVLVGGLVIAAGYLPTLNAPFDFIDDGNLVYAAPAGTTLPEYGDRWWDKVQANVEHLGPFRPTLWVHWELFANTLNNDAQSWRTVRLLWCGLAATALLWLMRELGIGATPALIASAAALWNPYRNEIWTSLTLAEGVAMPYALLCLVAARKAAQGSRAWPWDILSIFTLFMVLGCKNTFVALVPAQIALRLLPDGMTLREGWRNGRWAVAAYLLPLAMPAAHFVYFKLNWHAGQYETPGPSVDQALRILRWMKGAMGLDFLGVGVALTFAVLVWKREEYASFSPYRAALITGGLLLLAGIAVYLPLPMMAARYTMPAVWGTDIIFGVMLAELSALPLSWPKRIAWGAVVLGLAAVAVANVGRQERVAARANMLWEVVHHLEQTAPQDSRVLWISGDSSDGELNVEEGIHVAWHLQHRGRGDIRLHLADGAGNPLNRVELPPPEGEAGYRLAGGPSAKEVPTGWTEVRTFAVPYRLGKKQYTARLDARIPKPTPGAGILLLDPISAAIMRTGFEQPNADLGKLLEAIK